MGLFNRSEKISSEVPYESLGDSNPAALETQYIFFSGVANETANIAAAVRAQVAVNGGRTPYGTPVDEDAAKLESIANKLLSDALAAREEASAEWRASVSGNKK